MEEEIIIIVKKPPNQQTLTTESASPDIGAHRFTSRADAIAFLAAEAEDDRA